jgi:hypothetical protein
MTATMTATMTQVPATTTAVKKATFLKLDECFFHPAKTMANNATKKVKVFCLMPDLAQQIQLQEFTCKISCCLLSKTTQQL